MRGSAAIIAVTLAATGVATGSPVQTGLAAPLNADSTQHAAPELAQRLSDTGLYDRQTGAIATGILAFAPQYTLWSDGASKQRWLRVPPGTAIDAENIDAWQFPTGTQLWKQFGYDRPVETRLIERLADGSWRYASYVWNAQSTDARLAPAAGLRRLAAPGAPDGLYDIPSREDCRACHEGQNVPVLGVSALQLSAQRDPLSPNNETALANPIDLDALVRRGLLANLDTRWLQTPPRIVAGTAVARAALGYLHANCGHCHNDDGALAVLDLVLYQRFAGGNNDPQQVLGTLVDRIGDYSIGDVATRVAPGRPGASLLRHRMLSRDPLLKMPPLGSLVVDTAGLALIELWIEQLDSPMTKETIQ